MKRMLGLLMALLLLFASACAAYGETLYVDNRETDKIYPERLNLRAQPLKTGAILGLYYTGAQVNVLSVENEEYTHVEIGGVTGYMATDYLITAQEAEQRYGANSDFGSYRAGEVDLTGLWMQGVALRSQTDPQSESLGTLKTGDVIGLIGILDDWAYISATVNGEKAAGYVPLNTLTDTGELKVSIIAGAKADSQTMLYDQPNSRGEVIMAIKNGTACFSLFGRKEGEWQRVRVGGVSGWIKASQKGNLNALGTQSRSLIPYYPLMMQTKVDALLYSVQGDKSQRYMTLGQGMRVELLAECGDYAYVRTYEGGVGAYNCGDFGYVALSDLSLTQTGASIGAAQVDDGDLPVIVLAEPEIGAQMLGALCPGAQVRVIAYTQTDYVQIALDDLDGYIPKSAIRMLTGAAGELSGRIPQRATALEALTLRTEPSSGAKECAQAEAGSRIYVLGKFGDWAFVLAGSSPSLDVTGDAADQTGFVRLTQINAPASSTHLLAYVNEDKINLRSAGSRTGGIIGRVRIGDCLRIAEYGNDWTCVTLTSGQRGYVMTEYLNFE